MNLSPMFELNELELEDYGRFNKARELAGDNIFPALLITSIEQLIIKKCFNFAFEVFFGVIFEIGESLEITSIGHTKEAIAEFTLCMLSKQLKEFRNLQLKPEFYVIVNEIGKYFDMMADKKTLRNVKNILSEVKVNVIIRSEFLTRETKRNESVYTNLHVLSKDGSFYLLLETEDYMDEEALRYEEEMKNNLIHKEKQRRMSKLERKETRKEDRRVTEEYLMKGEERDRIVYLNKQSEFEESQELLIEKQENAMKEFIEFVEIIEDEMITKLAREERRLIELQRKEQKKGKLQEGKMKVEDNMVKRYLEKELKRKGKILRRMNRSEQEMRTVIEWENKVQEEKNRTKGLKFIG